MTEIEILFAPDGSVTMRVKGGRGKSCTEVTKAIRDAIGVTVEDRKLPEYYEETNADERVRSGSGS